VVFRLTPSGSTSYTYKVLYDFCSSSGCIDGDAPNAGLIIDSSGNLYGTTKFGGANNKGLVFELVKPTSGTTWTLTPVYSFCSTMNAFGICTDGKTPLSKLTYSGAESGLPYNGTDLLFGMTNRGGFDDSTHLHDYGVLYVLQLSGGTWSQKTKVLFNGPNGEEPDAALVMDASTNVLWGTTPLGGSSGTGAAFMLTPGADLWNDPWTEKIIYNFCWDFHQPCPDGRDPNGVVRDAGGNIYGAASDGGNGTFPSLGFGLVYKLYDGGCMENGVPGFWCNTTLFEFCNSTGCPDGNQPPEGSDLIMDSSGNLYGTTLHGGGAADAGIIYKLSGGTETVLYAFCPSSGCADGSRPMAGVIMDPAGNLYGTTSQGGSGSPGKGTVFKLTP